MICPVGRFLLRLAWLLVQPAHRTPSRVVGDEVIAAGAKGILFRSRLSPDGVNLVLYVDELEPTDRLDVHDPQRSLPQNQSSWT
ncbi:RES family NAD+ phosphorylase [Paraburkholderia phymatum]|uniref:RES family NAD+ phosphorylase n=1 Tax=Paraburkholderia phymatum TaxID=148447 RepID=A0ACC6UBF3_9BURK